MSDSVEAITASAPLLRPERLSAADVRAAREPFAYLIATGTVDEAARTGLREGFPASNQAGFIPHEPADCGSQLNQLIAEITSTGFADALGDRLGVPHMSGFPVLVTICSRLNKRHGTIHTDSRSKIASALLYLNDDWIPGSAGSLRLLAKIDDIDSLLTPEIPPLYGTLVAFKRADNSFHGHLPFEGERRVVQFAWLTDRDALERKTQRGHMQRLFKKIFGPLDRWLGARRGVNKAHRD
jgi:hypothetical protein